MNLCLVFAKFICTCYQSFCGWINSSLVWRWQHSHSGYLCRWSTSGSSNIRSSSSSTSALCATSASSSSRRSCTVTISTAGRSTDAQTPDSVKCTRTLSVKRCVSSFELRSVQQLSGVGEVFPFLCPLPSVRQHPSYGDWRLRGNIIWTALCWSVWHNVHSLQHIYMSSSYRS